MEHVGIPFSKVEPSYHRDYREKKIEKTKIQNVQQSGDSPAHRVKKKKKKYRVKGKKKNFQSYPSLKITFFRF